MKIELLNYDLTKYVLINYYTYISKNIKYLQPINSVNICYLNEVTLKNISCYKILYCLRLN